jgi:hypothetical protein
MRFNRPASPDWWDVLSAESDIDETLRSVMLQAVAVHGVPMQPDLAGPDASSRPIERVQATVSASRVTR